MAVSLSAGVRNNLSSLQSTTVQAQAIQNRLATGKRVNSAIDSPVNFFTAASLNDRSSQLTGLLDGISNGIQTIQAASKGIDGITKLGSDAALAVITPEFLGLVPGFFATDVEDSVRSLEELLRMCFAKEPAADELYLMLGYNVAVPPYVRQALFSRSFDNDDLLPTIRTPALLTHGANDAIVTPTAVKASSPVARNWKAVPTGIDNDTPGLRSTTSSAASPSAARSHIWPRPTSMYQSSDTVRCRTATDTAPAASVKWPIDA